MENQHGLTAENLLRTLPPALAQDEDMRALAASIAQLLALRPAEIDRLAVYPQIDRLDGPLLDLLAQDFKVDWWDSDYSIDEKRRSLGASWQVHKILGTRAAVEKAASAVYPETRVQEWFEYGGEPYRFKLDVDLGEGEWDQKRHKKLLWGMAFYKNLRSHMEALEYHIPTAVLENRQVFYFHGLLVYLNGVHAHKAYQLEHFRLSHKVKNTHLTTLASLTLYSRSGWRMQSRPGFTVTARANNWGAELIRLDGRRRLDGSWRLGQHLTKGLALGRLTVWTGIRNRQEVKPAPASMLLGRVRAASRQRLKWTLSARVRASEQLKERSIIFTFGAVNTQGCSAGLTKDNRWYFDGTYRFDGTRKWNAAIERMSL